MGLKEFIQDSAAVKTGLWIGKHFSLPTLRSLAIFVGKIIASRQSSNLVHNIKANQWVVLGENLTKEELQEQTLRVITSQITSLAEY
jgi:putative Ca2+/H+ antiporter (TMEM165/GDT1 family)